MTRTRKQSKTQPVQRPEIFGYLEYRLFLRDWFAFLKETTDDFSARSLAESAGLASGYLPMILSGARNLSAEALAKIVPHLHLNRSELAYLEELVKFGNFESREARLKVLERMQRFRSYRKRNPNEAEFYEYASRWYHLTIREMANLRGFKADPEWIQARLQTKLPPKVIREALEFLVTNGYLKIRPDGSAEVSKDTLRVEGPLFWATLSEFHKQMFSLAADSVETVPATERALTGYTFSLNSQGYQKAQEILGKAMNEIIALEEGTKAPRDAVYQLEMALFPLTKREPA